MLGCRYFDSSGGFLGDLMQHSLCVCGECCLAGLLHMIADDKKQKKPRTRSIHIYIKGAKGTFLIR